MTTPQFDCDVVIVGAGVAGAVLAWQLCQKGVKVIVLESGPGQINFTQRNTYLDNFKSTGAPYPINKDAPKEQDFFSNKTTYYDAQPAVRPMQGPVPPRDADPTDPFAGTNIINEATAAGDWFQSNYERQAGGSSWHWLGTCLRFLPNDFQLSSQWNPNIAGLHAYDWPMGYGDLEPWYQMAEETIGVAGEGSAQQYLGLWRSKGYPMPAIPLSYLDQQFQAALAEQTFSDGWSNEELPLVVTSTPQARNTTSYQGRAICQGSSSCIPICPIQAKYDATYHVALAASYRPNPVEFRYQSVATQVLVDTTDPSQPIAGVQYKTWDGQTHVVRGRIHVLAAHAVENAKLLLNSPWHGSTTVANSSDQVGRNLADHPVSLVYGITDQPVYSYRGPLSTAGVESLRDGRFRTSRGAFRMEIGNDGWSWPTGDPFASPQDFMSTQKLYGKGLASAVSRRLARQVRIGCLAEQLPNPNFRVTLSQKVDGLGVPRPQLVYGIDAYGQRSLSAAVAASIQILRRLIANPVIQYNYPDWNNYGALVVDEARSSKAGSPNIFVREGWAGAGHLMGTHRMGIDPATSVVNSNQRTHDHPNLYLLGSGSWPSYATGNPTLTITALALRAAQTILGELGRVTPVTAPGAPIINKAVAGINSATVSFSPPVSDGGAPITGYTATSTPGDISSPSGTTSPLTVSGLASGASFTFTVRATNSAGTSAPSASSNPVTTSGAPTVVSLPASSVPFSVYDDLKLSCATGPDGFQESPNCPVIQWGEFTFWPYSYIDNRISMCIVMFDRNLKPLQRVEKRGARYVWKITQDTEDRLFTIWGQANQTITVTWDELQALLPP